MYYHIVATHVPKFELYDVTTKLGIIYKKIIKYSKLQIFAKYDYLLVTNPQNLKKITKQLFVYKIILNCFVI